MTDSNLSPAAQAVLDAMINTGVNSRQWADGKALQIKLAAALRVAAKEAYKKRQCGKVFMGDLCELADELEGAND